LALRQTIPLETAELPAVIRFQGFGRLSMIRSKTSTEAAHVQGLRVSRAQRARGSWTASRVWLLWLIGTAVASAPLFVASLPPLAQHFYNLARVEILANPAAYAKYFVIRWDAIPDLAMDLVVPWMARLISVEQAAWIFLFATLALLTSGSLVLGRIVNGRWSALPLLSFLFLYNWILIRGYENNLFGLGLTLWALAVHLTNPLISSILDLA